MTIKDKVYHAVLCFLVTFLFDIRIGVTVALTIEATQVEVYVGEKGVKALKNYWWLDTIIDLGADAFGIFLAVFIKTFLGYKGLL